MTFSFLYIHLSIHPSIYPNRQKWLLSNEDHRGHSGHVEVKVQLLHLLIVAHQLIIPATVIEAEDVLSVADPEWSLFVVLDRLLCDPFDEGTMNAFIRGWTHFDAAEQSPFIRTDGDCRFTRIYFVLLSHNATIHWPNSVILAYGRILSHFRHLLWGF